MPDLALTGSPPMGAEAAAGMISPTDEEIMTALDDATAELVAGLPTDAELPAGLADNVGIMASLVTDRDIAARLTAFAELAAGLTCTSVLTAGLVSSEELANTLDDAADNLTSGDPEHA